MRVTYTGDHPRMYFDYIDVATAMTLTTEPGGTYDIYPVRYNSPDYPAEDFIPAASEPAESEPEPEDNEEEHSFSAPEVEE